jgi:hypothetical protein
VAALIADLPEVRSQGLEVGRRLKISG